MSRGTKRKGFNESATQPDGTQSLDIPEGSQSQPSKRHRPSQTEIIIAIDWGTTWSGVAWAMATDEVAAQDTPIKIIQEWPMKGSKTYDKVPTEVIYQDNGAWENMKWGFQAHNQTGSFKWMKLLLEEKYANLLRSHIDDEAFKPPLDKTPEQLAQDYLSALKKHIMSILEKRLGQIALSRNKIRYVFTVPVMWSDKAKAIHMNAAEKAGFGTKEELQLINEPEAAAVAAFRALERGPIRRYDCFTVVDCGGGTVDLVSYKLLNFQPRLEFKQITLGTGGACGSVFINKDFETCLAKKMGRKRFESLPEETVTRMMIDFEDAKQSFSDAEDESEFTIFAGNLSAKERARAGIGENGFLVIDRTTMRDIFQTTVKSILWHIKDQLQIARKGNERIKVILLVGGFGASPYLFKRVQEFIREEGLSIEILQPQDGWTAIVRGAVMHGLETRIIRARVVRKSYGICADAIFRDDIHPIRARYYDQYDDVWRAKNQMEWFIHKGTKVTDRNKEFKNRYHIHLGPSAYADKSNWVLTDTLYAFDGDLEILPGEQGDEGVTRICDLKSDLQHISPEIISRRKTNKDGLEFYVIEFDLVMRVEGEKLSFSLQIDGKQYSNVSTDFY